MLYMLPHTSPPYLFGQAVASLELAARRNLLPSISPRWALCRKDYQSSHPHPAPPISASSSRRPLFVRSVYVAARRDWGSRGVFVACSSLSSITIPASIERINYGAFKGCYKLETVDCKAVEPPFLGVDVFVSCNDLETINVPSASVDDYKAAENWSNHSSMITGKDFE